MAVIEDRKYHPNDTGEQDPKLVQETWEITTPGQVWVHKYDRRSRTYSDVALNGTTGPRRVRITADDRHYTQEQVLDDNADLDPFNNGVLVRIERGKRVDEGVGLDERVASMIDVTDPDDFRTLLEDIDSELVFRQLRDVVETRGLVSQQNEYRRVLDARWRRGGQQPSVREMVEGEEEMGGERLS